MANDRSLILKNGLLFTLAPFLPQAVNVLLLPIMTKYLTDVDYGISATITAYSSAIGAFSTLGLTVVLMNSFYKDPTSYKETWRQIYGFLSIWMIFFALLQAVLLYFFIPEEAASNRWLIILLTNFSTVLFGPVGTIGNLYYVYSKQSIPVIWRSITASILTIITDFVLIVYFQWGYMGWYVGSFVGTFFTNMSYWFVVNVKLGIKPILRFEKETIKHALKVGIPTIPHYYTNYLLEGSGKMVLDQFGVSKGEIGRLSVGQQFGNMINQGMQGMNQAISPFIMNSIKSGNESVIKKITLAFTTLIFVLIFIVALWSKEIFQLLLSNESLSSAYNYFIVYVMALCYRPMYFACSYYYFYYEHTKQLLLITFLSGCIALVLYIVLTPFMGIWGFLIGHFVACLYYGYSGYFYGGYKNHSTSKIPVILILLVHLMLTLTAYFMVEMLTVKIIVSVILAGIAAIVFFKNKSLIFNKQQ